MMLIQAHNIIKKTLQKLFLPLLFLAGLMLSSGLAYAVSPDEKLADPKQEQRARDISIGLRCLVCQNQSIDDSNAPLAKDLRVLVRERISAGDSNDQVMDFVVDKYGDFVLLKPPLNWSTMVLWLAPLLLLLAGLFLIKRFNTESLTKLANEETEQSVANVKLTDDEQAKLKKLLDE